MILAAKVRKDQHSLISKSQEIRNAVLTYRISEPLLSGIPFYYRQLFQRRNLFLTDYFIGQEKLLERGKNLILATRAGQPSVLCLSGKSGTGSSFLSVALARKIFSPPNIFHLRPPEGGSIDPGVFRKGLQQLINSELSLAEGLNYLGKEHVVIIDNLEEWWEKSPSGYKVLDSISKILDQYSGRVNFFISCNNLAFNIIAHTHSIGERFTNYLECDPMDAEHIEKVILTRHNASGIPFSYKGINQQRLLPWHRARIFSRIFSISDGNISTALAIWLGSIVHTENQEIGITMKPLPDFTSLESLSAMDDETILQCLLHRRLTKAKLSRTAKITIEQASSNLLRLEGLHLLRRNTQGLFEIEPVILNALIRHLEARSAL